MSQLSVVVFFFVSLTLQVFGSDCCGYQLQTDPLIGFQKGMHKRVGREQSARKAVIKFQEKSNGKELSETEQKRYIKLLKKAAKIDESNLKWLKQQITENGFLDPEVIGANSANQFFLLVLHADRDRKFQKQCLERFTKEDQWPAQFSRMLEIRIKQPPPPTIKTPPATQDKKKTIPSNQSS